MWQPFITGDRVFRTTTELREALGALAAQGISYDPELHDLEQRGDAVLVHGVLRVNNNGRLDETWLHWAYHFRDGRRAARGAHRARRPSTLAALRLLSDTTFTLAEDAGSEGERVIRLRGELDIESAPDLERALLRPRPARQRVVLDLAELKFMDSTGLRVLLRARTAADEGAGRSSCATAADHPPPVRHDRRARGAAGRDVLRGGLHFGPAVGVAQLVELLVVVQVVAGSSPVAHPSQKPCRRGAFARS